MSWSIESIKSFWSRHVLVLNCDPARGVGGQKSVMWSLPWPCLSNIRPPLMILSKILLLMKMMVMIDCEPWLWVRGLMGHRWPGSWRRRQFLLASHPNIFQLALTSLGQEHHEALGRHHHGTPTSLGWRYHQALGQDYHKDVLVLNKDCFQATLLSAGACFRP